MTVAVQNVFIINLMGIREYMNNQLKLLGCVLLGLILSATPILIAQSAEKSQESSSVFYASDDWLLNGSTDWFDESARRTAELNAYLSDSDDTRAVNKYKFKEGHNPALAWNWFDQHPIGYGGMPYVLLQTILSLDPATETNPHLLKLAKALVRIQMIMRVELLRRQVIGYKNFQMVWSTTLE